MKQSRFGISGALSLLGLLGLLVGCGRASLPAPALPLVATPPEPFREIRPEVPPLPPLTPPVVETTELDTGLTVMVSPRPSEVATVCYGNRDAGKDTMPERWHHLSMAVKLAVKGTALEALEVDVDHDASSTRLCVSVMPGDVGVALDALAEVLPRRTFPPASIDRVKNRALATRNRKPNAGAYAAEWLLGLRFFAVQGWRVGEALRLFDAASAADELARSFHPKKSVIAVAGPLEPQPVRELVERHLGHWVMADEPAPPPRHDPPLPPPSPWVIHAHVSPLTQAQLAMALSAPARDSPDRAAFDIASRIVGGLYTSRLNLRMRTDEGHTYGAHAAYAARSADGHLLLMSAVAPQRVLEAVDAMLDEVASIQTEMPTQLEVRQGRETARERLRVQLDTTSSLAKMMCVLFRDRATPDSWVAHDQALADVTPERVQAVVRRYFSKRSPLVVVGPGLAVDRLRQARQDVTIDP